MPYRDLDVLDAAETAADRISRLIERSNRSPRQLIHATQLQKSAQSVSANIGEGFGRRRGADCDYRLEIARGEAEEAIKHLRANFRTNRLSAADYWPLHNLLVVIVKMLSSILNR